MRSQPNTDLSPEAYFEAGVIGFCGEPQFAGHRNHTLLNPTAMIDVLSKSTRDCDRGMNFEHYRTLPSLQYLTIAQDKVDAEYWTRQREHLGLLAENKDIVLNYAIAEYRMRPRANRGLRKGEIPK